MSTYPGSLIHDQCRLAGLRSGRIVHTISTISPDAGGPSYSVTGLCRALTESGVPVALFTLDADSSAARPEYVEAFRCGIGPKRLGRSPSMLREMRRDASAGKIQLFHTHGMWMMPYVYPGWIAGKYGIPLVIAPRGTLTRYSMASGSRVKRIFWPLVQKPALNPAVCFHATSEAEYHDIRRLGFRQPVALIPNGVDEFAPLERPPEVERTVLYLGRIHAEKGIEELIRAWAMVEGEAPDWRLRVVGSGEPSYVTQVKNLAARLGVQRCTFSRALYGKEKLEAYRDCDIYALFSLGDNFAMTVAESLMAARPVITTKEAPWMGLSANNAGWWVEAKLDAFADALREAMGLRREQLAQKGQCGREWVRAVFSWRDIGNRMRILYEWLLGHGEKPEFVRRD